MNQLTTIAALPGSGAGRTSALKREVSERRPKYAAGGTVNVNLPVTSQDANALISKQIAEATRRTLLRIAGATA